MRRDRRLAALTSFGFLALAACSPKERAPEPTKRAVRCAAARATTITDAIELRGTVSPLPDKDAQIASQVVGRILQVSVREGDAVAVGQPIARIDSAALVDEARAAEAAVARTRAELKNAVATSARVQSASSSTASRRDRRSTTPPRARTRATAAPERGRVSRPARAATGRARDRAQPAAGRGRPDLQAARRAGRRHPRDPDRRGRRSEPPRARRRRHRRAISCSCGRASSADLTVGALPGGDLDRRPSRRCHRRSTARLASGVVRVELDLAGSTAASDRGSGDGARERRRAPPDRGRAEGSRPERRGRRDGGRLVRRRRPGARAPASAPCRGR